MKTGLFYLKSVDFLSFEVEFFFVEFFPNEFTIQLKFPGGLERLDHQIAAVAGAAIAGGAPPPPPPPPQRPPLPGLDNNAFFLLFIFQLHSLLTKIKLSQQKVWDLA